MTFDYETYLQACFSRHLSGILFFIVFCIALGRIIYALVTRPASKPVKAALVGFFALAVCMLTLTMSKTFQVVADIWSAAPAGERCPIRRSHRSAGGRLRTDSHADGLPLFL